MIRNIIPGDKTTPKKVAFLVSEKEMKVRDLIQNYFNPLVTMGCNLDDIIVFNLKHNPNGKIPVTKAREYLNQLEPILKSMNIDHVMVCDGSYFKALTKQTKVDPHIGYRCDSHMWDWANVFYCPGYRQMYFNPNVGTKITLALQGLSATIKGGMNIFDRSQFDNISYLYSTRDIRDGLVNLLDSCQRLSYDIETFSLKVDEAGIGTIALAPSADYAVTFPVDFHQDQAHSQAVRKMLAEFFAECKKREITLIPHGGTFDAKVLIWELFMQSGEDTNGLLDGLDIMMPDVEDTHTLAYLSLNSTAGNHLKLKELAFEYTGNYALTEINDITKHTLEEVLEYNAIDAMATFWLWDKYRPIVKDEQEHTYQEVFKPAEIDIVQMELTGLPMSMNAVLKAEDKLQVICSEADARIRRNPIILEFEDAYRELEAKKATAKLKKLVKTKDDFLHVTFNSNSNPQLQLLLYQGLGLPIIAETDAGAGKTDAKTLEALIEHEKKGKNRAGVIELIESLITLAEASKILTTFISAFKEKGVTVGEWIHLMGSFNLGGTKSGRLSSSNPNMQNLPSTGTKYAKLIKECFQPPANGDWLLVGADYFSLEDRISALQTRDPNKLAVYTDGYDGHCLRAFAYFGDQMKDIRSEIALNPDRKVEIINSIEQRYPQLRQYSKGPTFALTYGGTVKTLVDTFGLSPAEARQIDNEYHKLYSVSDEWVKQRIDQACNDGYVELAFGLRLRTPLLSQIVVDTSTIPYEAKKEGKTAGNALGQSYGLLNTYAGSMFLRRVRAHPKYRTLVRPCAQIHDSQYYLIRNTLGCIKWVNDNLVECMEWCELEEIKHPEVGLGAQLEVYYPSWANPIKIPNQASIVDIRKTLDDGVEAYKAQYRQAA